MRFAAYIVASLAALVSAAPLEIRQSNTTSSNSSSSSNSTSSGVTDVDVLQVRRSTRHG